MDNATLLRDYLGETIPEGGTDDDTMFTDAEITDILAMAPGNVERAAYEGWRIKAARTANFVDVTEGNASRKMSQLGAQATQMLKVFGASREGPTEGRTRVGRIVRPR